MIPYRDFAELVLNARKDCDYSIHIVDRSAPITIVAIHGGGIEPPTGELARAIAGQIYNYYTLRGIRASENEELRIPASRFEEMRLQALMRRSETAISLDGVPGDEPRVHAGGRDRRLRALLHEHLEKARFKTAGPAGPGAGHDPSRFYNQPTSGGVHLELTRALREEMVTGPLDVTNDVNSDRWTERLGEFVKAVRAALTVYRAEVRSDLSATMERFERATDQFPPELRSRTHSHDKEGQ